MLQAIVSTLLAHQTGIWHKWEATPETYYPLEVGPIRRELKLAVMRNELFYNNLPPNTLILEYESLFQEETIIRLCQYLDVEISINSKILSMLKWEENKLTDYRKIPNWTVINEFLGNDRTGWL